MRTDCALNIILIGMPGAGKSTAGVLLAKRLGYGFIDTDLILQAQKKSRLYQIIADQGLEKFKQLEADVLVELDTTRNVIATGGSAIYSPRAMAHLKQLGQLVFIDMPFAELMERVDDMDTRGLVIGPGDSFKQLYLERLPLYQAYAEVTIPAGGMTVEDVVAAIEQQVCPANK